MGDEDGAGMARRVILVLGGCVLLAAAGLVVAERTGLFAPREWRDAIPGLDSGFAPPVANRPDDAPKPDAKPPTDEVARPAEKPARETADGAAETDPAPAPDMKPADRPAPEPSTKPDQLAAKPEGGDAAGRAPSDDRGADGTAARPDARDAGPDPERTAADGAASGGAPADDTTSADVVGADNGPSQAERGGATDDTAPTEDTAAPGDQAGPRHTARTRDDAGMDTSDGIAVTVPSAPGGEDAPAPADVTAVEEAGQRPSFDIVRVERSGEAVIAGRAAPRSRVTVLQDDRPIATARADESGAFVAIPHRPLPPGQGQLILRSEDPESGETRESERAVVIDIPRLPDDDDAPRRAEARDVPERTPTAPQVARRDETGQDDVSSAAPPTGRPSSSQADRTGAGTPAAEAAGDDGSDDAATERAGADAEAPGTAPPERGRAPDYEEGGGLRVEVPPDAPDGGTTPRADVRDVPAGEGARAQVREGQPPPTPGARADVRVRQDAGNGAPAEADRLAARDQRPAGQPPQPPPADGGAQADGAPTGPVIDGAQRDAAETGDGARDGIRLDVPAAPDAAEGATRAEVREVPERRAQDPGVRTGKPDDRAGARPDVAVAQDDGAAGAQGDDRASAVERPANGDRRAEGQPPAIPEAGGGSAQTAGGPTELDVPRQREDAGAQADRGAAVADARPDRPAQARVRTGPADGAEAGADDRPQLTARQADPSADSRASEDGGGAGDAPIAVLVPREGTGEVEVLQRPSGEAGLQDRALVLEAVQYTVDGGITVSGYAPAQARIAVFLNDARIAGTHSGEDGRWSVAPEADVPPGLHTLRVDQLGPDGEMVARVSTPFANQPMVDDLGADEAMVVIQPGDNLWTIARRTYGEGWEYTLIYRANRDQIADPDLIYPGQVFVVPEEDLRDADAQGDGAAR
jgi:nucleoid-associated protein YgaU